MRVLIIEDDEAFAQWVSRCLPGCERITVDTCDAARTMLKASPFDVVILDLSLAKEESADWLRVYAPNSATICITGAAECLPKGFDSTEWKINLNTPHGIENLVYSALRKRDKIEPMIRDVESVEGCARLLLRHA
jgi:hypothetical protein